MENIEETVLILKKKGKQFLRSGNRLIKLFPKDYSPTLVYTEALCQVQLVDSGLPAPKVYGVSCFDDRLGLVMDYVKGDDNSTLEQFVEVSIQIAKTKVDFLPHQNDYIRFILEKANFPAKVKTNIE